jgi:branched-chain amino acid transport system ATP-binding protein
MEELLAVQNLDKYFGGLRAVNEVSFTVRRGDFFGLIGPNGAGKTTIFNLISGFLRPSAGTIVYRGKDVTHQPPHVIAAHGMARTFQKINVFPDLSTLENVLIGRHLQTKAGFIRAIGQTGRWRDEERNAKESAMRILKSVGLTGWEHRKAKHLPFGSQRALGIAVALATNPTLLLLDEPASGMNSEDKKYVAELIRTIHDSGITILLVEHDMSLVMSLCKRILVVDFGTMIAEGPPGEIQRNEKVIEIYLGKGYKSAAQIN